MFSRRWKDERGERWRGRVVVGGADGGEGGGGVKLQVTEKLGDAAKRGTKGKRVKSFLDFFFFFAEKVCAKGWKDE